MQVGCVTEQSADLDAILRQRIIGQSAAVEAVTCAFSRVASRLRDPSRPALSLLLLLGPTGVGRTETARARPSPLRVRAGLDPDRLRGVRPRHGHELSKLLDSPPGSLRYTRFDLTLELGPRSMLGMGRMVDGLKIGELAARSGVSRDTIRFYEREGLLPRPQRTPALYRVYSEEDEGRLLFIRQAQALGLTLDDIRELVRHQQLRTPGECRRVASLLRERIEAIDRKLAELRSFRRQLALSLEQCEKADGEACPVVLRLSPAKARQRRES